MVARGPLGEGRDIRDQDTVAAAWVSTTLDAFRELGLDPEPWRKSAGLSLSDLDSPDGRIGRDQAGLIWAAALEAVGDPMLGVRAGSLATWRLNHITTLLVVSANDLGSALRVGVEHQGLTGRPGVLAIEKSDGRTKLVMNRLATGIQVSDSEHEFALVSTLVLLRLCVGRALRPDVVCFDHDPLGPKDEYERLLRSRVSFGAHVSSIDLNNADLSIPTLHKDPALHRQFQSRAAAGARRGEVASVADRTSMHIAQQLGGPHCNIEWIAGQLGMSERSLQRALSIEGVTFRDLLERQRQDSAVALTEGGFDDDEIARLLGFAGTRSLDRARRRWVPDGSWRDSADSN